MSTEVANIHAQVTASVADYNRKMGTVQAATKKTALSMNSLKGATAALGVTMGAALAGAVIKNAITSIARFEKGMSDVKAVAGATDAEIEALRKNALKLGASTKFTATEVAGLSKELAKLGFASTEIIKSSKAILDLAAATDSELATAAAVAGTTLRSFKLDASEMTRVADVMSASFSRSALDINKFTDSMKFVAPIAQSAGVDIEFATAMLAKLADVGIAGSLAGTSLRRILLEMGKTGKPAAEAFREIASKGITLEGALDEVGRNAVTALNALSGMSGGVEELAKDLDDVTGATAEMAEVMEDNLIGDLTRLESAYDGLIQKGGVLNGVLRETVQHYTELLNSLSSIGSEDGFSPKGLLEMIPVVKVFNWIFGESEETLEGVRKNAQEAKKSFDALSGGLYGAQQAGFGVLMTQEQIAEETAKQIEANNRLTGALRAEAAWNEMINSILAEQNRLRQMQIDGAKEAAEQFEKNRQSLEAYADTLETANEFQVDFTEGEKELAANAEKADQAVVKGNKDKTDSQEKWGAISMQTASDIGAALALEGEERKKATREAIKANAAYIVSELIRDAVTSAKDPITGIIMGTAAAAGAALLLNKIPAFADGGIIKGPTLGMMGEYPGANTNPEVVGKLSDLRKMIGGGGVNVVVNGFVGNEYELARQIETITGRYNTR